jgi:hypothetical protein
VLPLSDLLTQGQVKLSMPGLAKFVQDDKKKKKSAAKAKAKE